jgi:cytochrome c oxidase assembly protein subunit 15
METDPKKIKFFRKFAFITTMATYVVIFLGGLVRVSGAGLGCPDWPKCFGRWIPPTGPEGLPPGFDPGQFNITLAWIEYFNRLGGIILGILILVMAILALKNFRHIPKIIIPSILALALVAFQGWQGSAVVYSMLKSIVVSLHLGLAIIIVSLMVYITQTAYYLENPSTAKSAIYPEKIGRWIAILWLAVVIQIILGAQLRSSIENLVIKYPQLSGVSIVGMVGFINYLHAGLGFLIAGYSGHLGFKLLKRAQNLPDFMRQVIWALILFACIQLILGLSLVAIGIPQLSQVFHLWIASLIIGSLLVLYVAANQNVGRPAALDV